MQLSPDERELLRLVAQSPEPVAMSSFFHTIHPPTVSPDAPEDDPAREAWAELQIGLYGASLALHETNLVHIVHPANGERPDLVEATATGRAALA